MPATPPGAPDQQHRHRDAFAGAFLDDPLQAHAAFSLETLQSSDAASQHIVEQGADKESNWLPAPDSLFSLQARLYWPKPEALDPLYAPPVEKA